MTLAWAMDSQLFEVNETLISAFLGNFQLPRQSDSSFSAGHAYN